MTPLALGKAAVRAGLLYLPSLTSAPATMLGRVVAAATDLHGVLAPGDLVVYERQSGHPTQQDAVPADTYGGDPEQQTVLLPLRSEEGVFWYVDEYARRKAWLEEYSKRHLRTGDHVLDPRISREEIEQHRRHRARLDELRALRKRCERTRLVSPTRDPGQGRGILAVIDLEDGETVDDVIEALSREGRP